MHVQGSCALQYHSLFDALCSRLANVISKHRWAHGDSSSTWMRGNLGALGPACLVRAPPVDTTSSMVYLITIVSFTRYPLLRFSSTDRLTNFL